MIQQYLFIAKVNSLDWSFNSVVDYLSNVYEILDSSPSITKEEQSNSFEMNIFQHLFWIF